MSLTLQQALADFVLQCFDLPARRGLRQKNLLRGAADVALLGHGHEVTQLSEFHAGSIIRMQAQANNLAESAFGGDVVVAFDDESRRWAKRFSIRAKCFQG